MHRTQKTSWADDVDEFGEQGRTRQERPRQTGTDSHLDIPKTPKVLESVDENGIITIVEYAENEAGKKVKVISLPLTADE